MNLISARFSFFLIFVVTLFYGCHRKEPFPEAVDQPSAESANIVTLTKENLEHVEIKTEIASRGNLALTLNISGNISANLNKTAAIVSTFEGRIIKLNFDINDPVKSGDVLCIIESPELLGKTLELKAPMDGVVITRKSSVGEIVDKQKEIYIVSDRSHLWVIGNVHEKDIPSLKVGQDAVFTVLAYPEEQFHGKLSRIGSEVDIESHTLEVRIDVENTDRPLKPGMSANIEISSNRIENALIVPDTAIERDLKNEFVFAALGENKFEKRIIKSGMRQQGRVQILDGIKEGEQIVVNGAFILKSEILKGELEVE